MTPAISYYLSLWAKYKFVVEDRKKFLKNEKDKELTVTDIVSISKQTRDKQNEDR